MLKKISIHQVRLGMHIHELCGPWMSHPFWRTKFVLAAPQDMRRLMESGLTELWIDSAKGLDVGADEAQEKVAAAPVRDRAVIRDQPLKQVSLSEEVQQAAKTCAKAAAAVKSMFGEVRMGKAIGTEAAHDLVEEISSSVLRNPGALISLARLKTADDYTYMHSAAVCALIRLSSGRLGVVLDQSEKSLLTPQVKVFFPPSRRPTSARKWWTCLAPAVRKKSSAGKTLSNGASRTCTNSGPEPSSRRREIPFLPDGRYAI